MGHLLAGVQEFTHRERLARAGGVVDAARLLWPCLGHPDRPLGEIARVDELRHVVRRSRREHFPTALDAHRPVGEAVGPVEWSHNETGPNDGEGTRIILLAVLFGA